MIPRVSRTFCAVAVACLLAMGATTESGRSKDDGKKTLDDGLLDCSWFGPGIEFRKTEDIDYAWVKAGFTLKGRKIFIDKWADPVFLGTERNAKDSAKVTELTEVMPTRLRGALSASLAGYAEVSRDGGDIVATGRFVDCNAGSKAKKFLIGMGAGKATATWDLKLTDKATGELLAAVHHRSVSGTAMSEIDDKIAKWLEKFGNALRDDLAIVASGTLAKK
jgi:uncharacterized protein DUF4410